MVDPRCGITTRVCVCRHFVKHTAEGEKEKILVFLNSVPLLSSLLIDEKAELVDAFQEEVYAGARPHQAGGGGGAWGEEARADLRICMHCLALRVAGRLAWVQVLIPALQAAGTHRGISGESSRGTRVPGNVRASCRAGKQPRLPPPPLPPFLPSTSVPPPPPPPPPPACSWQRGDPGGRRG